MGKSAKNNRFAFKNDRFKKNRGGPSRWLVVSCENCGEYVTTYQKDGPGILKRLYFDRLVDLPVYPEKLSCKKCKTVLGLKIIYAKENRPAYRLFSGAVSKRIIKHNTLK